MKKRRFSKQRFDLPGMSNNNSASVDRKDSDGSVMFMPDDRRGSVTGRGHLHMYGTSANLAISTPCIIRLDHGN